MFSSATSQTPRDRRNTRWIAMIQILWVACLIANGSTFHRYYSTPVASLIAVLPMLVGALMIWAYARFVRDADELQKEIQLRGLAFGFGVSVVFTLAYPSLERIGLPHFEPNHFAAVGVLGYFLVTLYYAKRYA